MTLGHPITVRMWVVYYALVGFSPLKRGYLVSSEWSVVSGGGWKREIRNEELQGGRRGTG